MNQIVFPIEIIGTIAFALAGSIIAIDKEMDILGVMILGTVTAVGGGLIRDVILNLTPPSVFLNPSYALTAIFTSTVMFLPAFRRILHQRERLFLSLLTLADSIGLGVFTVVGIATAKRTLPNSGVFLLTFVGFVTGVGGGILRDIFAGDMPFIFVKDFYASASIIGALCCVFLWSKSPVAAFCFGAAMVTILRLLAVKFHWHLPSAKKDVM